MQHLVCSDPEPRSEVVIQLSSSDSLATWCHSSSFTSIYPHLHQLVKRVIQHSFKAGNFFKKEFLMNFPPSFLIHFLFSVPLALLASFLLGLGDSCFNTQLYSYLSTIYSNDSASAFALFKFVQSIATSIAFIYSDLVGLSIHVLLLTTLSVVATSTFCLAEWSIKTQPIDHDNDKTDPPSPSRSSVAPLDPWKEILLIN